MKLSGDKARSPKAEDRNPARRDEIQSPKRRTARSRFVLRISGFGLLSDLGFRPSDLCCPNDLRVCL